RRNEARAAPERMTLHANEDGRGTGDDRLEHRPHRVRIGDVLLERKADRRSHPLDIGAGAEARTFTRQHDGVDAPDIDKCFGQLLDQLCVEGVAAVRSRERDAQYRVVALDLERAHGFNLRNEQGRTSLPVRRTCAGCAPVYVHAMRENSVRPSTHRTGRESRTESGYVWKCPAAQYGLQSFSWP